MKSFGAFCGKQGGNAPPNLVGAIGASPRPGYGRLRSSPSSCKAARTHGTYEKWPTGTQPLVQTRPPTAPDASTTLVGPKIGPRARTRVSF